MAAIVIIDENKLMRELLAEWLRAEGYRVRTRDDLARIGDSPDLVIVDLYRPRHEGCTRMRSVQSAFPRVPIIAISAQFQSSLAANDTAARALGARRVVAKPFDRADLVRAVRAVIGAPQAV